MPETRAAILLRALFTWYLAKFPLRDGKAYLYRRLHRRLTPSTPFATVRLNPGFLMNLDLSDPEQLNLYFYRHYHERYEAALVAQVLTPGAVFWDIGANIGYFTLVAAQALNHSGQVIALEPGANAFALLAGNISLNPFANIRLFPLAASDREGQAVLYLSPHQADSSANLFLPAPEQSCREMVATISLDTLLAREHLTPPRLIKVDVEGAEMEVLQGATGLLAGAAPLLLLEMEEKNLIAAGSSRAQIQEFLAGYGYHPAHLRKGRWYETAHLAAVKGRNIFWFKPDLARHRQQAAKLGLSRHSGF